MQELIEFSFQITGTPKQDLVKKLTADRSYQTFNLETVVGRGVECDQRLGWQGAATRHSQLYGEELQRCQARRWACYTPRSGVTF